MKDTGRHATFRFPEVSSRGVARVSLINGLTGIPLVVVFLEGIENAFHRELRSVEQVEMLRGQAGDFSSLKVWNYVESFFYAGGTRAHLLALPLRSGESTLSQMLGADAGLSRRTGIQTIREWAEKVDLLLIPQATELLEGVEYQGFCQKVFDLLSELPGILFLLDLPKQHEDLSAQQAVKSFFSPDSAVFHPWLLRGELAIPPSVVIAAWMQRADAEIGIQEVASELPLGGGFLPVKSLSLLRRRALLESRINTFHTYEGQAHVCGGYTLADRADWKSRLIPLRRSSVKLQQAAEQICEPYVLEAAGEELPVLVESSLQNFLRSVRKVFHRDLHEPFTTSVRIVEQENEERLQVDLNYVLPHSLERFSFSFVA